uniref:DIX domain-containing protein n=1 Tax=Neogobius melanostomus TaxID=47308 RepID=A0A8C6SCS0_9GOBI
IGESTRVIYHLEDQHTPYLVRIGVPAQRVTLARFFFRSEDRDFGSVRVQSGFTNAHLLTNITLMFLTS